MPILSAYASRTRRAAAGVVLLLAAVGAVSVGRAEPRDVASFLADAKLDREQRRVLEEPGDWGNDKTSMLIRVLAAAQPSERTDLENRLLRASVR
jgi:hypothetical protein